LRARRARNDERGPAEHRPRQLGGVEHGDDDHRPEVVEDRERGQEHLERDRHARAEEREHAEREGDVGGGRDRPAPQRFRGLGIQRDVDQRRPDHAAHRAETGQRPVRPGGEPSVEELALDLQAHEQKEHRHQAVVDPMVDRQPETEGLSAPK
jgi:hypothetical protein